MQLGLKWALFLGYPEKSINFSKNKRVPFFKNTKCLKKDLMVKMAPNLNGMEDWAPNPGPIVLKMWVLEKILKFAGRASKIFILNGDPKAPFFG